jgi:hypothetical protein
MAEGTGVGPKAHPLTRATPRDPWAGGPTEGGYPRQPAGQDDGGGGVRGDDGAKQIKGRTRHLLVETQGLVLAVNVHPADVMDRDGVVLFLPPEHITAAFPRLTPVWLEAAYHGKDQGHAWIEHH